MTELEPLTLDCSMVVADALDAPPDLDEMAVGDLVRFAMGHEQLAGRWIVNIALVDEDDISRLHAQFLGDPTLTDIITFPYDEPGLMGGDIVICLPVAAEQGPEHGKTLTEELYFLILHGLLHLGGGDDSTSEMRTAMLARQQEIFDAWQEASR